jgi:hypothetical protein
MYRAVFGFLAIVWLVSPIPALAEWIRVSSSVAGSVYYMDGERISSENGRVRAWVKVDHSKNRSVRYRSEMQLWSFICASQKTKLLSYTEYDSYGKTVGSNDMSDSVYSDVGYSAVTPETVAETIMTIACAQSS